MEELRAEHSELERKSLKALYNMYEYCQFRVFQLQEHRQNLSFRAEDELELTDLFRLAERLERVETNFHKFSRRKSRLEQELMRRRLREECIVKDVTSR